MADNQRYKKQFQLRLTVRERQFIILFGDLIATVLSLFLAIYFWAQPDWLKFSLEFIQERIPLWFYLLPVLWLVLLLEIYDIRKAGKISEVLRGIVIASIAFLGLYLLIYFSSAPNSLPRRGVAIYIIATFCLTLFWRFLYIRVFTTSSFLRRVLVIGAGKAGQSLANIVKGIKPTPFHLVGFVDDDPEKADLQLNGYKVFGTTDDLLSVIQEKQISDLIFSISKDMHPATLQNLLKAQEQGVEISTMPIMYEELLGRVPIMLLESDWILRSFVDQAHKGSFYDMARRIVDIVGGLVGIIFLIVLTPFVSLAILLDSGSPIFYSQKRLGKNGKPFTIYKFRTMYQDAEKEGKPIVAQEEDERITRIGKVLRKSHIDEFPQFVNILLGDISIVGPRAERPELAEELQNAIPFYRARLLVKPGLTGWAQVNFGYASTIESSIIKLEYDLYYIKHQNLLLDLSIVIRTAGTVFGLRGR